MSTTKAKSVDVALEVTKQLITLSSALIPLSIGIMRLFPTIPTASIALLVFSSFGFLVSIGCGILVYGGTVSELRGSTDFDVVDKGKIKWPARIQWLAFALGVFLMICALFVTAGSSLS